jgi:glycosyltransferase involved in cell wall biosynthesis
MRIGTISDVADTGFGRVGRELNRRFLEAGHDIRILGINFDGREGAVGRALKKGGDGDDMKAAFESVALDPVLSRTVPAGIQGDGMGHNVTAAFVAGELVRGFVPERVLLVADPVAALERLATDQGTLGAVPTLNYVPIEGEGLSMFWRAIWRDVKPVAMSRFGQEQLATLLGRDDVPYVPHGISPSFYPVSPERPGVGKGDEPVTSREEAKRSFGWEGRTVILRTDRLVDRKAYPEYFKVIRRVIDVRDDVLFVIHCATEDEGGMMATLLADLPGAYRDRGWRHSQVTLTRGHDTFRGMSDAQLNIMYQAADIYASTARSEGFGLTLAEAVAVGTPVVVNDFGAIPETVGEGGILVKPAGLQPTSHGHAWAIPDVPAFAQAILDLVDDEALRARVGAAGIAHAARFDWDMAAAAFLRLMEDDEPWKR